MIQPLIVQELEGHKLSDTILERLPTLCALSPGGKISFSEVVAFHNVIKSESFFWSWKLVLKASKAWIWSNGMPTAKCSRGDLIASQGHPRSHVKV